MASCSLSSPAHQMAVVPGHRLHTSPLDCCCLPRSLRKARVILRVARQGSSEPTAEQNREVIFLGWQVEGHGYRTGRTNPSREVVLSDQEGEGLESWGRPRLRVRYSAATWQHSKVRILLLLVRVACIAEQLT